MTIHVDVGNGVATVVFDDPATLNAMSAPRIAELHRIVEGIAAEPELRVLLMRAEGPAFGAGGDIASLRPDAADAPTLLREIGRELNPLILRLHALPAIVVAAVHGAVAGGSVGLIGAADLVIAADDTRFNMAYSRLGASPDAGNSWFLPRLVGARTALEWLLLSDTFDAETARAAGLVNRVVPAPQLRAETDRLVARLLAGARGSQVRIKHLVRQSEDTPLARQLDDEIEHFAQATASADFAEGVAAFLQKRAPRFGLP